MNMKTITLQSAFRLRNSLKKSIELQKIRIRSCEISKEVGTEEDTNAYGTTMQEMVKRCDRSMCELLILNQKIEAANNVNRNLIEELQTVRARLEYFLSVEAMFRSYSPLTKQIDNGVLFETKWEPKLDSAEIRQTTEALRKEKDRIEAALENANTTITIEVDAEKIGLYI
jgi:vacuolar-type H+-ATPase subunit I/STV1